MTRFVYIADTHFGADPTGWHLQEAYPERLPEVVGLLDAWIRERGDVAFVLHGGDAVDRATEQNVAGLAALFSLSVPVYVCLGNHDVRGPDARDLWLRRAPALLCGGRPEYSIRTPDCVVHVLPNHWEEMPYFWDETMHPHFLPEQVAVLDEGASRDTDAVHVLVTHSPVLPVPCEQTGLVTPFHNPEAAFQQGVFDLLARCPHIRCVLGGHSHVNSLGTRNGVRFVTASAFVETPFDFKLFEIEDGAMRMGTVALGPDVRFRATYDFDRTYTQGRPCDRAFEDAAPEDG